MFIKSIVQPYQNQLLLTCACPVAEVIIETIQQGDQKGGNSQC